MLFSIKINIIWQKEKKAKKTCDFKKAKKCDFKKGKKTCDFKKAKLSDSNYD